MCRPAWRSNIAIYLTLTAPFFQWIALYAVFIPWATALKLARDCTLEEPGETATRSV